METSVDLEIGEKSEKKEKKMKTKKTKKVAKKAKASKKSSKARMSVSGKYKNIRALMETLFAKNKEITMDQVIPHVKKEFPGSAFTKNPNVHFSWYKSHVVAHREFTTMDAPAWAKGSSAKVKKQKAA